MTERVKMLCGLYITYISYLTMPLLSQKLDLYAHVEWIALLLWMGVSHIKPFTYCQCKNLHERVPQKNGKLDVSYLINLNFPIFSMNI